MSLHVPSHRIELLGFAPVSIVSLRDGTGLDQYIVYAGGKATGQVATG